MLAAVCTLEKADWGKSCVDWVCFRSAEVPAAAGGPILVVAKAPGQMRDSVPIESHI